MQTQIVNAGFVPVKHALAGAVPAKIAAAVADNYPGRSGERLFLPIN